MLSTLDIAITATLRPALLDLTLWAFERNLLSALHGTRFRILLNIDPIWGKPEDADSLIRIARRVTKDVIVNRPESPGFGSAVQWLWSKAESPWILHLEDDWILLRRIDLARLERELARPQAAQIRFNRRRNKLFSRTRFSLNPSLLRRAFVEDALSQFDPKRDPEKQILRGHLRPLERRWRYYTHGPALADAAVLDTGRHWREVHDIEKSIENLASIWTPGSFSDSRHQAFSQQIAEWRTMVEAADDLPAI